MSKLHSQPNSRSEATLTAVSELSALHGYSRYNSDAFDCSQCVCLEFTRLAHNNYFSEQTFGKIGNTTGFVVESLLFSQKYFSVIFNKLCTKWLCASGDDKGN